MIKWLTLIVCMRMTHQQSACPFEINTTESYAYNGDFELPKLTNNVKQDISLPGWISNKFEIGRGSVYNPRWGSNTQVVEMAGD